MIMEFLKSVGRSKAAADWKVHAPKKSRLRFRACGITLCSLLFAGLIGILNGAQFAPVQRLTNQEIFLQVTAPTGLNYRIETSTNLPNWGTLATFLSTGLIQHLDSAAPFLTQRFYRGEQLDVTNVLTGDHLATSDGDVVIHPVGHASFVMSWNGKMIYNDPTNGATAYQSFPRADLILVSHLHNDHFSTNSMIYHPQGAGNGYVLTLGGKRLYMSGDTEDVPAMRALTNIDVAFV